MKLKREVRIVGDVIEVPLTRGYVAVVDLADYELVRHDNWCASVRSHTVYAGCRRGPLHRLLMQAGPTEFVDHIDGDGLNNRRSNLRLCYQSQNMKNIRRRRAKLPSSQYKGVTLLQSGYRWGAYITVDYRRIFLGSYRTELEAAVVYDEACKNYFGDYAAPNFTDETLARILKDMSEDGRPRRLDRGSHRVLAPYKGIRWHAGEDVWEARIRVEGADYYLGRSPNPEDAAQMYDAAARFYFGSTARTNFPGADALPAEKVRQLCKRYSYPIPPGNRRSSLSPYRGVAKTSSGTRWRARIKLNGREVHLGCFDTPELAAAAYDKAATHYYGPNAVTNCSIKEG